MGKYLTIDEVKQKIFQVHGDTLILDESTYIDTRTLVRFIDKDYGEWFCKPSKVFDGQKNRKRKQKELFENKKIPLQQVKERLFSVFGDLITIKDETYISVKDCAIFIDKEYGEYVGRVHNVLRKKHYHKERKKKINRDTCQRKYGVNSTLQLKEVQEKIKDTNIKLYGKENCFCSKEVQEKRKKTWLDRYGVANPQQNREVSLKTAKSANNVHVIYHWKSGECMACIGSYEKAVVEYFNKNKVEFYWQPVTFTMPNNKTYRPDLLLVNESKWIEIKGYFWGDAKNKWDWFHKEYPNSELWDKNKLKELQIL